MCYVYFNTHTHIHEKLRTKPNPVLGHPGHLAAGLPPGTLLSPPPQPWHRAEPLTTSAQPSSSLSSSRGLVSGPDVCSKRRNVLIPNGNVYPESSLGPQPPGTAGTLIASRLWLRGRPEMEKHTFSTPTHVHGQGHHKRSFRALSLLRGRKTNPGVGGR